MKIRLTMETDMKKLFELKKSLVSGTGNSQTVGSVSATPDVKIILVKAPMIQYE